MIESISNQLKVIDLRVMIEGSAEKLRIKHFKVKKQFTSLAIRYSEVAEEDYFKH